MVGGDPLEVLDLGQDRLGEVVVSGAASRVERRVLVLETPLEHSREFAHGVPSLMAQPFDERIRHGARAATWR